MRAKSDNNSYIIENDHLSINVSLIARVAFFMFDMGDFLFVVNLNKKKCIFFVSVRMIGDKTFRT